MFLFLKLEFEVSVLGQYLGAERRYCDSFDETKTAPVDDYTRYRAIDG